MALCHVTSFKQVHKQKQKEFRYLATTTYPYSMEATMNVIWLQLSIQFVLTSQEVT